MPKYGPTDLKNQEASLSDRIVKYLDGKQFFVDEKEMMRIFMEYTYSPKLIVKVLNDLVTQKKITKV